MDISKHQTRQRDATTDSKHARATLNSTPKPGRSTGGRATGRREIARMGERKQNAMWVLSCEKEESNFLTLPTDQFWMYSHNGIRRGREWTRCEWKDFIFCYWSPTAWLILRDSSRSDYYLAAWDQILAGSRNFLGILEIFFFLSTGDTGQAW